jgi:hypothetical protein
MGHLRCLRHEMIPYWTAEIMPGQGALDTIIIIDQLPGRNATHVIEPNRHRWIGYVEPLAGTVLCDHGDSGSLVYAINDGAKVLLGIWLGLPASYGYYFGASMSLETYFLEAKTGARHASV